MLRTVVQLTLCLAALEGAWGFNMAPLSPARVMATSPSARLHASRVPGLRIAKQAHSSVKMTATSVPKIIQGGMGVQVSSWRLAREVSKAGELGVISGTAMDMALCRWLQNGDPGGHYRRALSHFPDQDMVKRAMDKFFIEGGKPEDKPYRGLPMWTMEPDHFLMEMTVLGNFAEVWLAKHTDDNELIDGKIGINCLTKIQLPTIPNLYGAMYADVDYVLMGAGIPMEVPGILDSLQKHQDTKLAIDVDDSDEVHYMHFKPTEFWEKAKAPKLAEREMQRPNFLPIVGSVTLAQAMLKRATGAGPTKGIQGFVIELPTAGGHNAPPRGFRYDAEKKSHALSLNEKGEPIYGPKDEVDLEKFKKATKGLPFWLAGYYARPEKLQDVLSIGGAGIQVGTSFAFTRESGLVKEQKEQVYEQVQQGDVGIFTDPVASPTGFPFKVVELEGSLSQKEDYNARPRVCNLGYLRTAYQKEDGKLGYRCASEPVDDWLKKGGEVQATEGRKCLCNGLMANAGLPQVGPHTKEGTEEKYTEQTLLTAGDDINQIRKFVRTMDDGKLGYTARDVLDYLLGRFKEEYNSELNLYENAELAEDGEVKQKLVAKKEELKDKIAEVDEQLSSKA